MKVNDWGHIKSNGKDMAIDTEHGLIYVSEEEFNDVRDRYFFEQKTSDDGCYILTFEVAENYTETTTIGFSKRWKKIKEPSGINLDDALNVVADAYKHGDIDMKKKIVNRIG